MSDWYHDFYVAHHLNGELSTSELSLLMAYFFKLFKLFAFSFFFCIFKCNLETSQCLFSLDRNFPLLRPSCSHLDGLNVGTILGNNESKRLKEAKDLALLPGHL